MPMHNKREMRTATRATVIMHTLPTTQRTAMLTLTLIMPTAMQTMLTQPIVKTTPMHMQQKATHMLPTPRTTHTPKTTPQGTRRKTARCAFTCLPPQLLLPSLSKK